MRKTTEFRKLINGENILVLPVAYDAIAAKMINKIGFQAVALGGYAASATLLGVPDLSLLTFTEMVNYTRNVVEAVDIPVFTDADTGYGNVTNVRRAIREFEKAGAAGLFIEDQTFPLRCGGMEGKQVIAVNEMVAKIRAAVDARTDPDFVIMARTDAFDLLGADAAIERGIRYREAGADLICVAAQLTRADMIMVNREIEAPTMAIQMEGLWGPMLTNKDFEEAGYNVVVYPGSTLYAAAWAVKGVLEELMDKGTTRGYIDKMITFNDFNQFIGLGEIRTKESQYYMEAGLL